MPRKQPALTHGALDPYPVGSEEVLTLFGGPAENQERAWWVFAQRHFEPRSEYPPTPPMPEGQGLLAALASATQTRTCDSSTGNGTEPCASTASWKARTSNFGPSAASASRRRRMIVNSPSL